jgi:peptide/nickel transport system substrate-binding protein
MPRTQRASSWVAVIVVLFGLIACTPPSRSADEDGEQRPSDATIPSFTYGLEAMPPTLDVANNYNSADMAVMGLVTQSLEIPNLDGTFTPVLAEKVTQPDPLTLVYDLRADAVFSDGSPLTPEDVVWTIEHLRGETTQTVTELADFKTVEVTGDHQVTVTLARPNNAARGSFAIISFIHQAAHGAASGDALGTPDAPPIGTGPYVVEEFTASGITLTRNPEYVGDKTSVDRVEFIAIGDDNAAQLAMRSEDLDAFPLLDVKTSETWQNVPGASLYSSPTMYLDYLTFNTEVAPFDDVRVRRAIAYATDVDGLLAANYGDEAAPPRALTPAQILTRMAPDEASLTALEAPYSEYTFDLEKAREELAQSSVPDGFTAEFEYYSPAGKVVGLSLAENLEQIGITVNLESRRLSDFIGDLFVGKVPDMGFFSISAVVPDPASWYLYLVGEENPYNAANFSSAETEEALEVINTSPDDAACWSAMETITETMASEVPYVALAQPNYAIALGPGATFTAEPDFMQVSTGNWIHLLRSTE